jgi:hypothetical protein
MKRIKPPARKAAIKRTPMKRHRARVEPGKGEAARAFKIAVCGALDSPLEAHHCVPAQNLRRIARSRGLTGPSMWAMVYDPRIAIPLTHREHERHTNRVAVIPAEQLPASVREAAAEYGPEALAALDREHPGWVA